MWAVLGVLLVIAEIFTTGFVLLWFGVGAFAAALAGLAGFGYAFQFFIFFAISIALTAASRVLFVKYMSSAQKGGALKSGVEGLPGKIGTVVSSSHGAMQEGAVKVFGSTWTAYPAEGEDPLEAGDRVTVESVRGASIYVRKASTIPEWRRNDPALPQSKGH
ncbi:MAG: NfeD family protein [Pyrinomonadaceae bacterium]